MLQESLVTFETKCWENDWEILLRTNRLRRMILRNKFNFEKRYLLINNVQDYDKVSYYAQKKVDENIITDFFLVKDYEKEVLDYFNLTKDSLGIGYVYSIAELTGIFLCHTQFLLHFSSDAIMEKSSNWIDQALEEFSKNNHIKVANPTWDMKYDEARSESHDETKAFYIGYGFSDQSYLVRVEDFRQPIYNELNSASERYPKYGGELFEKRVDSWMRNNNFLRITHKQDSYRHQNFPKGKIKRRINLFLDMF